ncbi:unnamed protein product, partial [Sphacelaria rigidula]
KRALLYPGHVVRMHDDRLPNIVMHGVMVEGKRRAGRPARRLQHCITGYCSYTRHR